MSPVRLRQRGATSIDAQKSTICEHLQDSAAITRLTSGACGESILAAARLIAESFAAGGKLLLCGNGGSAADCQHMAAEFTSRLSADFKRPGLPAIALTTDVSFLTAFSNDFAFEGIFARQLQAVGNAGDVLFGISTSGNSKNVIRAFEMALLQQMRSIALTGAGGGQLSNLADVTICIPSDKTQHVQEAHLAVEHVICHLVERAVFGDAGAESWGLDQSA